jgi:subtilase family serine protease
MRAMRLFPLRVLVALTAFVLLASASTGNAATVVSMRALPGTQLPLVRQSARLATTADSTPVSVVLSLQPRNRALLARAASSHTAMSDAQLRSNFAPSRGNVVAITRYMQSHGFRLTSAGLLSLSFSGDAGSARRAFGVGLSTYRSPSGHVFRAPDGAVKLPAGLAPIVEDVSGLDTALRLERHTSISPGPHTVPSPCGPASIHPGYQPSELAQAYHHDTLITAGGDGTGETIGLVEFTNYKATDIGTYESCYGFVSNPVVPVSINGGAGTQSAAIEAELDIEVAISNAPGVSSVRVYSAPNNVSQIIPMLDTMVSDHVTVVSDSWGLCEPFLPPSFMEAESTHLALLAISGASFFAATGDSGSSDCAALTSGAVKGLYTDDPSSQPFATAVGGTTLVNTSGLSTTWVNRSTLRRGGGGGGVSALWPQPAYQAAYQLINPPSNPNLDTGAKCGNFSGGTCRETPDVALDANPDTGYIIYCSVAASGCGPSPWFTVGGTSGSAPLMAAIAADANRYSLLHGGQRMRFANPFLYSAAGTFADVPLGSGNNNIYSTTGNYATANGYDMATGLGSPDAMALATALAAYTPGAVAQDATKLAISGPLLAKTVVYGKPIVFHGTLLTSADAPIANRRVYLELREGAFLYVYVATTDSGGLWSVTLTKQLQRNLTWSVNFPGSDTEAPAKATDPFPQNAIHIVPHLGSASSATTVRRGVAFTFHGASLPNMHGVAVAVQARRSTSTAWRTLKLIAVAKNGTFAVRVSTATPGALFLRWVYAGGVTRPWMSAVSLPRRVNIT